MLLTRCPECHTTFRITRALLGAAGGRVRCGRCERVFDAGSTLSKQPADAGITFGGATGGGPPLADVRLEKMSLREVVEQVQSGGDADDNSVDEDDRSQVDISASAIHEVLEHGPDDWPVPLSWKLDAPAPPRARSRAWHYAAAAAALLLLAQALHHYRAEIATRQYAGPLITRVYAAFGASLVPSWDLGQYRIMDWVATAAEADADGSLTITARIHNRGPHAQPHPHMHLQLKDRWERPVGSRIFHPQEYLPAAAATQALMAPGATAHARLEIVDPGSDAYGFELDVCVEVQNGGLACATDLVFR